MVSVVKHKAVFYSISALLTTSVRYGDMLVQNM